MISGMAIAAPAIALPAPLPGAQAVDWDHFGEPSLSTARRANVAASRALQAPGAASAVDTRLYRLPGDVGWEQLLDHYKQSAGPHWRPETGAAGVDTANPARQQRFTAAEDAGQRFAVVWLPAAGEVRDGLLMVLRTVPAR
ncbi:hypothetical protein ASD88_23960 [Pelomonas sp. Root662]|nr:hypothetical protein ASC81_22375 [Pelomonas sp. Root405]KRA67654.1 hypothetical protein ASD88_23960 [Pelomonas sp. Root662]